MCDLNQYKTELISLKNLFSFKINYETNRIIPLRLRVFARGKLSFNLGTKYLNLLDRFFHSIHSKIDLLLCMQTGNKKA